jgi:aquaporin Z
MDACFYVLAQFVGGLIGLYTAAFAIGTAMEHPAISYVVTMPGRAGTWPAFAAAAVMSFGLMLIILLVANSKRLNAWTGCFAGALVAVYIIIEAPICGMSINPARTVASVVPADLWTDRWIYLTAPCAGMLTAAECYVRLNGAHRVLCAKVHHHNDARCVFRCRYMA